MDTLAGEKINTAGLVQFNVESLSTGEVICSRNAVANEAWLDDEATLLHRQDLSQFPKFDVILAMILQLTPKVR